MRNQFHTFIPTYNNTITNSPPIRFVKFSTQDEALRAIEAMAGYKIDNKALMCKLSDSYSFPEPSGNLYIKPLPPEYSEDQLVEMFEEFGEIMTVRIVRDVGKPYDVIGFVRFKRMEEAGKAVAKRNGMKLAPHWPALTVKYAESDTQRAVRKSPTTPPPPPLPIFSPQTHTHTHSLPSHPHVHVPHAHTPVPHTHPHIHSPLPPLHHSHPLQQLHAHPHSLPPPPPHSYSLPSSHTHSPQHHTHTHSLSHSLAPPAAFSPLPVPAPNYPPNYTFYPTICTCAFGVSKSTVFVAVAPLTTR